MEQEPPVLIDDVERRRAIFKDLAELALLLGDLRLPLSERGDVVHPEDALAPQKADVPTAVCHLDVGNQHVNELTLFRRPNCLLVEELAAALAQRRDDPGAMIEVVPEPLRVEELQLVLAITHELAKTGVVKQQPPI